MSAVAVTEEYDTEDKVANAVSHFRSWFGILASAAALVGYVQAARQLAGDHDTAARLAALVQALLEESELLEGVERFDLPVPDRRYPPGSTLGYLLRFDAHTRAVRRRNGLSLPDGSDG